MTDDVIHREWVVNHYRISERWGVNIYKCRVLLEIVLHRQARGQVVDIASVMQENTGTFIL